tara:strand:- start:281 stop:622 length:342 start_codon:yes stop_codon:yes gene_type:complete
MEKYSNNRTFTGLKINFTIKDPELQRKIEEALGEDPDALTLKVNCDHKTDQVVLGKPADEQTVKRNDTDYGGYSANNLVCTKLKKHKLTSPKDKNHNPIPQKLVMHSYIQFVK